MLFVVEEKNWKQKIQPVFQMLVFRQSIRNSHAICKKNNALLGIVARQPLVKITAFPFSSSTSDNSKESSHAEPSNSEAAQNEPSAAALDPKDELIAKLSADLKELTDRLKRSLAEEENVRRIARRDVDNAKAYANSSFAKALLDVGDDLERALASVPEERKKTDDAIFNNLVVGIEMTEKQLQKVFSQFAVAKFGQVGDKFDPEMHDALFNIPGDASQAGTVGQILKSGYKLKDRVIRAAQVGTVVGP